MVTSVDVYLYTGMDKPLCATENTWNMTSKRGGEAYPWIRTDVPTTENNETKGTEINIGKIPSGFATSVIGYLVRDAHCRSVVNNAMTEVKGTVAGACPEYLVISTD